MNILYCNKSISNIITVAKKKTFKLIGIEVYNNYFLMIINRILY